MKMNGKVIALLFLAVTMITCQIWRSEAMAQSSYFTSRGCIDCHAAPAAATCAGCHHHSGTLAATTNKATPYTPGEAVAITLTGTGARTGWIGVRLYNQSGVEIARSTGNQSGMGGSGVYPAVLSAPAPAAVGTYTWRIAYLGNLDGTGTADVHGEKSVNVSFTVASAPAADTAAPVVTFALPATATSLTVPVSAFTATDNVGVTGYIITSSATPPAASAAGWTATAPVTVTAMAGSNTFYAWAKDAAGNVSAVKSASVTVTLPDATAPVVNTFTLPATATNLTLLVSAFTATDNVAVTGYLVTTTATAPAAGAAGWSALPPATVNASAAGNVTFYAWAKDAAGNVSLSKSATTAITISTPDASAPTISAFMLPATSTSLTVPVTALVATDNIGVTGYIITTSSIAPAANAAGWSALPPSNANASTGGNVTFYAWAKDAAGNVSMSSSAVVAITIASSDTVTPVVSAFTLPATSSSLSIPLSSLIATDNIGVAGYLVTTSSAAPAANAAGWSVQPPATVTATATGMVTFYAWAKDAAGNVSASRSASVTVTVAAGNVPPVLTLSTLKNGAYTNNATLNISGTVTSATGIKSLTINGQPVVQDEAGAFTYALTLIPGVNKIKIVAVSSLGKAAVKNYNVKYDPNAPVLKVVSPADNAATAKSFIAVRGAVNERATVTVKVNDGTPQNASIHGNSFSATVYLTQGDNTIEVTATDLAGNVTHAKRTITYDNTKPSLEVTSPNEDVTVRTPSILLKGAVSDALSDVKVKVYMNGKWYVPTVENGAFQQQLTFTAAKLYPVAVVATDEAGNTIKVIRNIIYKPLTAKELEEAHQDSDKE